MRTKTISISERDLMFVIGGQLFNQAPNRQPRKAEIIMQKVRDGFRQDAYNDNEFWSIRIEEKCLYKFIKKLLMDIPEFQELNLTQVEYEKNVKIDDESRPRYAFTTQYDKYDSESWKHDFIDLDAFVQNVHYRLLNLMDMEEDCFCCKYENKGSELCKTCLVNPDLKYNYECGREPKGKYTFSCKYDCPEQKMICCEECSKSINNNGTCPNTCDGKSDVCGNKVME